MLPDSQTLGLLLAIILAETAAQYYLQKMSNQNEKKFLMEGLALYIIVGYMYYLILTNGSKLAIANALWNAGSSVLIAIVGYIFFSQKLNMKDIVGLALIILGVIVME